MWRMVREWTIEFPSRRITFRSVRYRPWVGMAILFLISLPFTQTGKSIRDSYVAYSGTVVDKGFSYDILAGESDPYLVIQDLHGTRTKRYVTLYTHAITDIGTYVEKQRGFKRPPRSRGWQDPRDTSLKLPEPVSRP